MKFSLIILVSWLKKPTQANARMVSRRTIEIETESLLGPFITQIIPSKMKYPPKHAAYLSLIGPFSPRYSLPRNLNAVSAKTRSLLKFEIIFMIFSFLDLECLVRVSIIN